MTQEFTGELEMPIAGVPRRMRMSMLELYKLDRLLLANKQQSILALQIDNTNIPLLLEMVLVALRAYEPGLKLETLAAWATKDFKGFMAASVALGDLIGKMVNGTDELLDDTSKAASANPLQEALAPVGGSTNLSQDAAEPPASTGAPS